MANKVEAFVVQHTMVGVHRTGEVVTFTDDQIKKAGVDVKRLLRIGAVREASDEEAKEAKTYGDTDEDTPRVFPTVPFEAVAQQEKAAADAEESKPATTEVKA